jgi:hypothetical protein
MTCIAFPPTNWAPLPKWSVSNAGIEEGGFDTSITFGGRVRDLYDQINDVSERASLENWDGEGARPVDSSTVAFARMFAEGLPPHLPVPDVSPDTDGDISFEWDSGPRQVFSVSVRRDGFLSFAGLFGPARDYGSDTIVAGIPTRIIENITRACAE